jgi:hypothetical protein
MASIKGEGNSRPVAGWREGEIMAIGESRAALLLSEIEREPQVVRRAADAVRELERIQQAKRELAGVGADEVARWLRGPGGEGPR